MPRAHARRNDERHRLLAQLEAAKVARQARGRRQVELCRASEAQHHAAVLLLQPIARLRGPVEDNPPMTRMLPDAHANARLRQRWPGSEQQQQRQKEAPEQVRNRPAAGRFRPG